MLSEEVDSAGAITDAAACIVCSGTAFVERWPGLIQCEKCDFITADMRHYGGEDFEKLYGHDYFHGDEYHDYIAEKAITQKSFKLRMRKLDRFLDSKRHRSVLEIGSAYGFFLDLVKDRFPKAMGTDVAVEGVKYAQSQGLDVRLGDLSRMDLDDSYDVVCLWDTIEHLAHPEEHLKIVSDRTRPGALITVTTVFTTSRRRPSRSCSNDTGSKWCTPRIAAATEASSSQRTSSSTSNGRSRSCIAPCSAPGC
jgi:hypothetical protein